MHDRVLSRSAPSLRSLFAAGIAAAAAAASPGAAMGQALDRAVFVGNNGNLEGSVTSLRVESDGSLTFVDKLVTGERPVGGFDPGTNAYGISLTPDGKYIAVSHTTASTTVERVTIIYVHPDATLELFTTFETPNSPLDLVWIDDDLLAVTQTSFGNTNFVHVYEFDRSERTFTLIDSEVTGQFNSALAMHPSGEYLFAQDSTGYTVTSFRVNPDGTLTFNNVASTAPVFPLGIGVTNDGTKLYGGGGISDGRNKVVGLDINPVSGHVSQMPGSPFISPGNSPKAAVASSDDEFLFVAHGTDATCRVFEIDRQTGALTYTGHMFDVGSQGTFGAMAVLDGLLFLTDNSTVFDGIMGVYSFTVGPDGSLNQNGDIVDTQGIAPQFLVTWPGSCPADWNGDGVVDSDDLFEFLADWADGDADYNGDGVTDSDDLFEFLADWAEGC